MKKDREGVGLEVLEGPGLDMQGIERQLRLVP